MSRWYEHPCTGKVLEGDQVLNVLLYLNEAKESYKKNYVDINSKTAPLEEIIKIWPDKSSVRKEWLRKVIDSGPMNDKMQSMATVISQFPMHSFYYLDHLITLVNFNKKRFAITASEILTDLFVKSLLPNGRPLLNLKERPLLSLNNINVEKANKKNKAGIPAREKILTFWFFEEQLKTRYIRFLKAMEEMLKCETDKANKLKMLSLLARLCQKKESQSIIVSVVVNKLGDNDKKVIGSALSKLRELQKEKSLIPIMVRAVRKFAFRPNLSMVAQYYAIQLLTTIKFNKKHLEAAPVAADDENEGDTIGEVDMPTEVIQIYIGVLKRLMEASKTKCEKLYSAIMCGISRAIPYANSADVKNYTDAVFKLVHSSNLNLAVQGLKVLFTIVSSRKDTGAEDAQKNMDRFQRLVYRTLTNPMIYFNAQRSRLVEVFFKSVSIDDDVNRAKTMVKRLLQLCVQMSEPGFICVCLIFLSKLIRSKLNPIFKVKTAIEPAEGATDVVKMPVILGDDGLPVEAPEDDNEIIADIVSDGEEEPIADDKAVKEAVPTSSWVHADNIKLNNKAMHYDPFCVDPKFANVEKEELVELRLLKNHSHPTVRLFVDKILKKEQIQYTSDPSEDFSLTKFLDRFAFKNPKKERDSRKHLAGSCKVVADPARALPVNSKQFADLSEAVVPLDELFFHRYFNHAKKTNGDNHGDEDEEEDSQFDDSDTEFDALLGEAEAASEDEEDDLSMSDMDMDGLSDDLDDGSDDHVDEDGEEEPMDLGDDDDEEAEEDDEEAEEDDEEEEDDDEEEATIHSSKRRKLGSEMASITTGAMETGRAFDSVQRQFESKRKHDRKVRKGRKEKKVRRADAPPADKRHKAGKRKFGK